jgi:hypothetical protein
MTARPTELAHVSASRTSQFSRSIAQNSEGLDPRINPDKPPRNFRDVKALDKQAWAEACDSEYLGFVERGVFKVLKKHLWNPAGSVKMA